MSSLRFGTAGVRGVFGETIHVSDFLKLALAVVMVTKGRSFVIGWDSRKTSALIGHCIMSVPQALGREAIVVGMVPTPVVAFTTRETKSAAGFSVTASHNTPEFAGMKVFGSDGMELQRDMERSIEDSFGRMEGISLKFDSKCYMSDGIKKYIEKLIDFFGHPARKLRVLIDCANGPGALITPVVLSRLGHEVITLNCQTSWRFPARNPEPTPLNLEDVSKIAKSLRPDVAFAHDGDADRLVLIGSSGEVLPHSVGSILLLQSLELNKGTVVLSENMSNAVEEVAVKMGLRVERAKIGKTFVNLRGNAILAMEPSKAAFRPWGYWEDGIFAAIAISKLVASRSSIINEVATNLKWKYSQIDVMSSVDIRQLKEIVFKLLSKQKIARISELDGAKFILDDGSWIMVRKSGTEPKVRIYYESGKRFNMHSIAERVAAYARGG